MLFESNANFLEGRVSRVRRWKFVITHIDNVGDETTQIGGGRTASKAANSGGTSVDGTDEFGDDLLGAGVVHTVVELGNDGVGRAAEGVEGVLDVGDGPLFNDPGNGSGEGHCTGGEDSEDGRETHGEEAWEGYFG